MPESIFAGRTALVTGGGRGIGRAICVNLARHGCRVAINCQRNVAAAAEALRLVEAAGGRGLVVEADVSRERDVERMVAETRRALGPIDFLVNSAGIADSVPHDGLTFGHWKRTFEVNLDGTFLATWAVKDEMIARRFGRIVNISSLAGLVKKPRMIHYATSKAAVIALTRSCAEAFAPFNVRVNCVAPGLIETDITRAADPKLVEQLIAVTPLGRIGQAGEIAATVRFLLCEESSFITGQTIAVCGGRV
ncbi:MAG TPA: 3-oxoacyl-ACP reductase FabG [Pirellulales bacterium]|nr:3-oxoacyl-ACP reductase FabG [Pirellulales bacterium]